MKLWKLLCAAGAGLIYLCILTACGKGPPEQAAAPAQKKVDNAQAANVVPMGSVKSGTIHLSVAADGNSGFKLNKNGRLVCPTTEDQGCIKVPQNDRAVVTFSLNAKPGWHLAQITICPEIELAPCTLTVPQIADFCFSKTGDDCNPIMGWFPNPSDGTFDLTGLDTDLQGFVIHDRNTVKQKYVYTIVACKDEGEDETCTTADPPWDNGGTNIN